MEELDPLIWYKTNDPKLIDISHKSRMPESWFSYIPVSVGKYSKSVLKPINGFVQYFSPCPELVSINNNIVRLRQYNYAEILLVENEDGFTNIERPHMRQYYNTGEQHDIPENCFNKVFKFFMPWLIDDHVFIRIENAENSPFFIYEQSHRLDPFINNARYIEPPFIPFSFKRDASFIKNGTSGVVPLNSPMYDIVFEANDILVQKIRNFYEKEK